MACALKNAPQMRFGVIKINLDLYDISKRCAAKLISLHTTISFAESCTGGLIAKALTDHSGVSDIFECGIVSYSGRIKNMLLDVSDAVLEEFGEVSSQTAAQMAEGVAKLSGSDVGVGVTGIAGPTGATQDKKVGLIYVAIYFGDKTLNYKLELYDEMTRDERRNYTACFVYHKILELL